MYVQSEQVSLNTTEVTQQQCSVSFGWQRTNDLTSRPVDLWGRDHNAELVGGRDAGTSGAGASAPQVGTEDGTASSTISTPSPQKMKREKEEEKRKKEKRKKELLPTPNFLFFSFLSLSLFPHLPTGWSVELYGVI